MRSELKEFLSLLRSAVTSPFPKFAEEINSDILDSDRRVRQFGYTIVLIMFDGCGGWAVLAPLESAARGVGTVQVEGNRKPVQHLEGGIVDEILVANGDYVTDGQPLLNLDATQQLAEQSLQQQQRLPLLRARAVGVAWRISSP